MIISLIAAMAENGIIGKDNGLPWDLPRERRRYRDVTMGHPIIMGRKTFESIGRALPGRTTIVLTRSKDYHSDGCIVAHSLQEALKAAGEAEEVFISGGAEVYAEAMPLATSIYLTIIHRSFEGDTFFPNIPDDFQVVSREEVEDVIPYVVVKFSRRRAQGTGS